MQRVASRKGERMVLSPTQTKIKQLQEEYLNAYQAYQDAVQRLLQAQKEIRQKVAWDSYAENLTLTGWK